MVVNGSEMAESPLGSVGPTISETDLRETAYEIFIGVCRSSTGSKPLTYKPQTDKSMSSSSSSSFERTASSLTSSLSTSASKVKKALGITSSSSKKKKKSSVVSVGELMRVQLRVSEQTDSRVRRALLRIAASQGIAIAIAMNAIVTFVNPSDF